MPSIRNARSSERNKEKNATVDLTVQMSKRNVKMNQPFSMGQYQLDALYQEEKLTMRNKPNES